ncbi:hypothetical protein ACOSP7_000287 [Xanthoceras sorbifolium]
MKKKKKAAFSASTMYMRLSGAAKVEEDGSRKGYVPLLVGSEEVMERILVPTKLIDHPYIVELLELSANEYGYKHQGLLKIQYDADCFKRMVDVVFGIIVEVDVALLRNLLEETTEESREEGEKCSVQSLNVNNNYEFTSKIDDGQDLLEVHDLTLHDMMNAVPSVAIDEIMVRYIDDMVGMIDYAPTDDYSQFHNRGFSDEINYYCLWQH